MSRPFSSKHWPLAVALTMLSPACGGELGRIPPLPSPTVLDLARDGKTVVHPDVDSGLSNRPEFAFVFAGVDDLDTVGAIGALESSIRLETLAGGRSLPWRVVERQPVRIVDRSCVQRTRGSSRWRTAG